MNKSISPEQIEITYFLLFFFSGMLDEKTEQLENLQKVSNTESKEITDKNKQLLLMLDDKTSNLDSLQQTSELRLKEFETINEQLQNLLHEQTEQFTHLQVKSEERLQQLTKINAELQNLLEEKNEQTEQRKIESDKEMQEINEAKQKLQTIVDVKTKELFALHQQFMEVTGMNAKLHQELQEKSLSLIDVRETCATKNRKNQEVKKQTIYEVFCT